jgi:hypothetical protein
MYAYCTRGGRAYALPAIHLRIAMDTTFVDGTLADSFREQQCLSDINIETGGKSSKRDTEFGFTDKCFQWEDIFELAEDH